MYLSARVLFTTNQNLFSFLKLLQLRFILRMFPTHLCYCPTQCYLSIQNSVPGSVIVLTLDSPRERICLAGAGSAWRGGGGSWSRQQGQAAPSPRSPCSAAPAPSTASPGPGYQAPWTVRMKVTHKLWESDEDESVELNIVAGCRAVSCVGVAACSAASPIIIRGASHLVTTRGAKHPVM